MPSSWPIYSYLVFAAGLGILLPIALKMTVRAKASARSISSNPKELGKRVYLRFFMGVTVCLLLLAGAFLLLPLVVGLPGADQNTPIPALWVAIPLLIFLTVGLFYAVKKGELSWKKELLNEGNES
jgi:hypothetical protein